MSWSARLCMRRVFNGPAQAPSGRRPACSPTGVLSGDDDRLGGLAAGALGAQPLAAVGAHRLDDRDERAALLGQRVLDARRDLRERLTRDDALLLERPQAQGEGARGDALAASARARRSGPSARRGRGSRASSTCHTRCRRYGRRDNPSSACEPPFYRKASLTEVCGDLALLRPRTTVSASGPPASSASKRSSMRAAAVRRRRRAGRRGCSPARRRGAAGLHPADQQPVALGQPDGGAQLARGARWGERDAERGRGRRLAARERVHAGVQRGVGGQREDQPAVHAHGVDPEQAAVAVDERAAGRPARQRRGVLERAADPAAARPAEASGPSR